MVRRHWSWGGESTTSWCAAATTDRPSTCPLARLSSTSRSTACGRATISALSRILSFRSRFLRFLSRVEQWHMADQSFEVLVVGGGPAGLSAALYLARYDRRVALFDAGQGRSTWHQVNHNYRGLPGGVPTRTLRELGR